MIDMFAFERAHLLEAPFRHFYCPDFIGERFHDDLADWLETAAPWRLKQVEDFVDIYELSLGTCPLPAHLEEVRSAETKEQLCRGMESVFGVKFHRRVDVGGQKMIQDQRVRVHTDFGEHPLTHRIVIQLNRAWDIGWGGLLLLLKDCSSGELSPDDRFYPPARRLGIGFEVSPQSYHAVSPVKAGVRLTLIYSFYCQGDAA
jgi:hypothetical protein